MSPRRETRHPLSLKGVRPRFTPFYSFYPCAAGRAGGGDGVAKVAADPLGEAGLADQGPLPRRQADQIPSRIVRHPIGDQGAIGPGAAVGVGGQLAVDLMGVTNAFAAPRALAR